MNIKFYPLLLLTLIYQIQHSFAQKRDSSFNNTHLTDVIINENRLNIPFESQNRNITILHKAQIQALPVQSINEILSYISGVDVRQRGPFGSQADISIDGGTFEQVTILVNGIKMNDPQSGHNSMNLPIPVNAIERIEVLRGSSARIYGVNSLTGAINIITTQPNKSGAVIQLNAGSNFKENEEKANKNYLAQGIQLLGGFANEKQNHLLATSLDNSSGHRYNTAYKNQKVFYQGNMTLNSRNNITIMGGYVHNNFGANGFYAAPADKESLEITQTAIASLGLKSRISDRLRLSPQVNYRYSYDDYRFYRNDLSTARNQHYIHTISPELNANYTTSYGEFGLGAEARLEKINSSNLGNHTRNNIGLYAEFRTEKIHNFQLSTGTYFNYNNTFGWRIYPGLDLGYSINNNWKAYVNTGTGQRLPSFTDLHYDTPGNQGNENLLPENAWYAEGGIKFQSDRFNLNTSYFYRNVDNFIDWVRNDIDDPWVSENFYQSKVNGITLNADYQILQGADLNLFLNTSYTYLDAQIQEKSHQYSLSKYALENLRHQAIMRILLGYKNYKLTATERFQERVNNRSYFLSDMRLTYAYSQHSIFVNANNVFDQRYTEAGMAPMPGRWYSIGLKIALK